MRKRKVAFHTTPYSPMCCAASSWRDLLRKGVTDFQVWTYEGCGRLIICSAAPLMFWICYIITLVLFVLLYCDRPAFFIDGEFLPINANADVITAETEAF